MTETTLPVASGPLREWATLAAHHAVRGVLPLTLRLRGALARSGYERLLVAYRLDFLRQQRAHPRGVAYRLLQAQDVAPGVQAYRLQAPPGVRHDAGDTLLLQWRNAEAEVQALLRTMGWSGDEPLRLRSASSAFAPGRVRRCDVATALRETLDFRAAIEAGAVAAALRDGATPQAALATWPRLQARSYSITDIQPGAAGEVIEILVSAVTQHVPDVRDMAGVTHLSAVPASAPGGGGQTWPGRCGGYLARLRPGIDEVRGWPLAFPMRLRPRPDARAAPLLVVATGIAMAGPLFELQAHADRTVQMKVGAEVPAQAQAAQRAVWLLWGIRDFDAEQPLLQRVLGYAAAHPALRLDIALSRGSVPADTTLPPNVWVHSGRVQKVLQAERTRVDALFRDGGDMVVIGHESMGEQVRLWLRARFADGAPPAPTAGDDASAAALLTRLEGELRVQYSLSGR